MVRMPAKCDSASAPRTSWSLQDALVRQSAGRSPVAPGSYVHPWLGLGGNWSASAMWPLSIRKHVAQRKTTAIGLCPDRVTPDGTAVQLDIKQLNRAWVHTGCALWRHRSGNGAAAYHRAVDDGTQFAPKSSTSFLVDFKGGNISRLSRELPCKARSSPTLQPRKHRWSHGMQDALPARWVSCCGCRCVTGWGHGISAGTQTGAQLPACRSHPSSSTSFPHHCRLPSRIRRRVPRDGRAGRSLGTCWPVSGSTRPTAWTETHLVLSNA